MGKRGENDRMRIKAPGVEKDQHRFISACGSRDDAMHSLRHYQVRLRQSHRLRYRLPRLLFATAKPLLLIPAIAALFFLAASRL